MDDNYSLWERHEREKERWLEHRPTCAYCDNHIQEATAIYINDEWICDDCIATYFRKIVEDY